MDASGNNKKSLPMKGGKVNEMCREWLVREDGAFAYHLQAQEINQHYTGNKSRNQQVREDFPCALDEQQREQQLAEQAAAVYQRMLLEQEEVDEQIAHELAERLEREEEQRKRAIEMRDESMARQLMHRDKDRDSRDGRDGRTVAGGSKSFVSKVDRVMGEYVGNQPRRQAPQMPLPKSKIMEMAVQQRYASNGVDRNRDRDRDSASSGPIKLKPSPKPAQAHVQHVQTLPGSVDDYHDLYTEPYQPPQSQAASVVPTTSLSKQSQLTNLSSTVSEQLGNMDISDAKNESSTSRSTTTTSTNKISSFDPIKQQQHTSIVTPGGQQQGHQLAMSPPTSDNVAQQLISSVDNQQQQLLLMSPSSSFDDEDELKRLQQEERDAEFARQLQEQETNSEENIMIRDRMLAMEAQDKELARLLQEREKAKARRAKERAKQRALQKKMALEQQSQQLMQGSDCILLPDDSYSNPVDLLPPKTTIPHTMPMPTTQHMNDQQQQQHDLLDDAASNYSLPVDTLLMQSQLQHQLHQTAANVVVAGRSVPSWEREQIGVDEGVIVAPVRPSQLDLRSPGSHQQHQKISKPRYPDPPAAATATQAATSPLDYQPPSSQSQQHYQPHSHNHRSHSQAAQSYAPGYHQQHANIAMAIDPTYSRRHHQHHLPQHQGGYHQQSHQAVVTGLQQQYNQHNEHELVQGSHNSSHGNNTPDNSNQSSSSQTTTPGTPCTPSTGCTSSSSSGHGHYQQHDHDIDEREDSRDGSPVPPYMPIQGQRRGAGGAVDTLYHPQGVDVVGGGSASGGSGSFSGITKSSGGVAVVGKSRKKHGKEGGGGGCKQQ